MIDALDGERIERVKQGEATPGVLHEAPILAGHLIRAHGVEEDVDADARPAALGERRRHLPRDGAVFIDEVGERDRRSSLTDRRQHGREDLVSVQEEPGPVARGGARQGMGFQRPREGWLAHVNVRRDIVGMTQGAAGQGEGPGDGKSPPRIAHRSCHCTTDASAVDAWIHATRSLPSSRRSERESRNYPASWKKRSVLCARSARYRLTQSCLGAMPGAASENPARGALRRPMLRPDRSRSAGSASG